MAIKVRVGKRSTGAVLIKLNEVGPPELFAWLHYDPIPGRDDLVPGSSLEFRLDRVERQELILQPTNRTECARSFAIRLCSSAQISIERGARPLSSVNSLLSVFE